MQNNPHYQVTRLKRDGPRPGPGDGQSDGNAYDDPAWAGEEDDGSPAPNLFELRHSLETTGVNRFDNSPVMYVGCAWALHQWHASTFPEHRAAACESIARVSTAMLCKLYEVQTDEPAPLAVRKPLPVNLVCGGLEGVGLNEAGVCKATDHVCGMGPRIPELECEVTGHAAACGEKRVWVALPDAAPWRRVHRGKGTGARAENRVRLRMVPHEEKPGTTFKVKVTPKPLALPQIKTTASRPVRRR